MAYSNSSLVNYTRKSPNYSNTRKTINRITIHHMAGNLTVEQCGNVFANKGRQASSNYGIGTDGRIGLYVDEKYRSWCSSNATNDNMAVTIEVANTYTGVKNKTWDISGAAYNSLINLCVDICRRNGFKQVMSIDSLMKGKTVAQKKKIANEYVAPAGTLILTQHNYFNATACPGNYIINRWAQIVQDINKILGGATPAPAPQPTPTPAPTPAPAGEIVLKKYIYKGVDYGYVFNPTYYTNKYPDLKKAYGTNAAKLFNHFCTYGMNEGRQANSFFNVLVYKNNYADLQKAFGNNLPKYYEHYCVYGYKEGRKAI